MEQQETVGSKARSRGRGECGITLIVPLQTKEQLRRLAARYDRPVADIIRAVLRVGIPMMDGMSKAEEVMVKEYVQLFRKLRQVKALKDI